MKLQPEAKKEFHRMACGVALCTVIMLVLFAALGLVGVVSFNYKVLLGAVCGAAVALGNFYGICVMSQKVLAESDERRRKMIIQLSYNRRMMLQAAWVVIAVLAPCFQWVAGVAPLIFPRLTIYYLQITGQYRKDTPKGEEVSVDETTPLTEELVVEPGAQGGETKQ